MCGLQEPGYNSKDLSEISYLGLLLGRMSRTVKVSDPDASTFSKIPPLRSDSCDSDRTFADMRWVQVNCAILCREGKGSPLNYEELMT